MESESIIVEEIEDALLLSAMQAAGDERGSLEEVKAHLFKIVSTE